MLSRTTLGVPLPFNNWKFFLSTVLIAQYYRFWVPAAVQQGLPRQNISGSHIIAAYTIHIRGMRFTRSDCFLLRHMPTHRYSSNVFHGTNTSVWFKNEWYKVIWVLLYELIKVILSCPALIILINTIYITSLFCFTRRIF